MRYLIIQDNVYYPWARVELEGWVDGKYWRFYELWPGASDAKPERYYDKVIKL